MSTKTERLGLDIWQSTDPVNMAGFNQNHQRLEEAVGHAAREELMDITVQTAAAALSVPMSGIDWAKYDYVVMDYVLWTDSSITGTNFRVNGSTDSGQNSVYYGYTTGDAGSSDGRIATSFSGEKKRRITFQVFKDPATSIMLYHQYEHCFGFGSWPAKTYADLDTLVISSATSGNLLQAGGTIKLWGVRG